MSSCQDELYSFRTTNTVEPNCEECWLVNQKITKAVVTINWHLLGKIYYKLCIDCAVYFINKQKEITNERSQESERNRRIRSEHVGTGRETPRENTRDNEQLKSQEERQIICNVCGKPADIQYSLNFKHWCRDCLKKAFNELYSQHSDSFVRTVVTDPDASGDTSGSVALRNSTDYINIVNDAIGE